VIVDFGRDVTGCLATAESKEWLCTNGIGGFASGTVAGMLTRRYHGLLVAALAPPVGRALLVSKLDELVHYDGLSRPLFTNRWADGTVDPAGHRNLESFVLDGTTPVWTWSCADALVEKRMWMEPGANTTYAQYSVVRARGPVTLAIAALVNYRDYHGTTQGGWRMTVEGIPGGVRVEAFARSSSSPTARTSPSSTSGTTALISRASESAACRRERTICVWQRCEPRSSLGGISQSRYRRSPDRGARARWRDGVAIATRLTSSLGGSGRTPRPATRRRLSGSSCSPPINSSSAVS
jgi:glycogen debranching enzyme